MFEKTTKFALFSRIIILVLQFLANSCIPDHKPDVFRKPLSASSTSLANKVVQKVFGGLRHWDGEYFLHIAEYGYSYENTLAFYPAYPLTVRLFTTVLKHFHLGLTLHNWMLLVAVVLNVCFFCLAANKLYELTYYLFEDLYTSWHSVVLFCFNPASIFFTAAYSEALYCWLSFSLMLECVKKRRLLRTVILLSLSIVARSNGLTNIGYPVYFTIMHLFLSTSHKLWKFLELLFIIIVSLIPLTFFNFYAFLHFCWPNRPTVHHDAVVSYGLERNYLIGGQQNATNLSPWCKDSFPLPYSYIQSHYWNVGLLRYYQWRQIPNFLLALPLLWFLLNSSLKYIKGLFVKFLKHSFTNFLKENKALPFVIHCFFLSVFCLLFAHIQISTRLLCSASPCIYWYAAHYLPKTLDQVKLNSRPFYIFAWFGSYYVLGTILFANNLPWT